MIRKFSRSELESEPHGVLFRDLYPWDAIDDTPFGASLALVQPGGRTILHSHDPAETFVICRGRGTIVIDGVRDEVVAGDVIYLPPGSVHELRNDSPSEELTFVSVFWKAQLRARTATAPRLFVPSPPTPNGPLHLGHLAGPYLLADVLRRYYRARGVSATLACVTDDHQSYVADRAASDGVAPEALAARYASEIGQALAAFDAVPDVAIASSRDEAYHAAVRARFDRLVAAGRVERREVATLACERCAISLFDSYATGGCPHCGEAAFGTLCEACSEPFDSAELTEPRCDRCGDPASQRRELRWVFAVAPYRGALADYHQRLRLAPRLRRLAATWRERELVFVVSQRSSWGLPISGTANEVISPWFELALAATYLRERTAPDSDVACCFGADNAFLYLMLDPAVSLALDESAALPRQLHGNEFLLLGDAKMSTSRQRALDANTVLAAVPSDLVRLYLAKIRPETSRTNANPALAQMFVTGIARTWQRWLDQLGAAIARDHNGRAPTPANASLVPWPDEQAELLRQLDAVVARAGAAYERGTLQEAASACHELVERAASFAASQHALDGASALAGERATGLALELAAARVLAIIAAPLMPRFALALWHALGQRGDVEWSDDVAPIASGTPIAIAGRTFLPQEVAWPMSS